MGKLEQTLSKIAPKDLNAMEAAQKHLDNLTKPRGSLGVLEEIVVNLAGITGEPMPKSGRKVNIVMAGDHGVTTEGISAFPSEVTPQMVLNFLNGGAAINVLCRHAGVDIVCCDIGVASHIDHPELMVYKVKAGTNNMTNGPAMSMGEAIQAIEVGIAVAEEQIQKGAKMLSTGEMGIGNTTPSAAILKVITNCPIEEAVGRGSGITEEGLARKTAVIKKAIEINKPDPKNPLDVLAKVGGLEIAGLVGVILAGAANKVPVVIDGFISSAAALIANGLHENAAEYMLASHVSEEPGHRRMLQWLGLYPMLHMKMRLGEGTGAALAFNMIEAAIRIQSEMATFESAGVSKSQN